MEDFSVDIRHFQKSNEWSVRSCEWQHLVIRADSVDSLDKALRDTLSSSIGPMISFAFRGRPELHENCSNHEHTIAIRMVERKYDFLLSGDKFIAWGTEQSPKQNGPTCSDCGALMIRNGTCYKCYNCGSTSGCS